jgi:hypothetical protein
MFLFRSLTIGLLGACVMLLVRIEPSSHTTTFVTSTPEPAPPAAVGSTATIVDVAPGLAGAVVPSLIRLAPGERVVTVDDRAVASDLEAGAVISAHGSGAGSFVDLEVASDTGDRRRVLVLMH